MRLYFQSIHGYDFARSYEIFFSSISMILLDYGKPYFKSIYKNDFANYTNSYF